MFAFFRRILSSWVAVAILGLIMVAFIVTGVGTGSGGISRATDAETVATVGGHAITVPDLVARVEGEQRAAARQQPGLTMPAFLAVIGGAGPIVEQYLGSQVLSAWAAKHGLAVSERLIGGEIGSIPAFQGPAGTFDQKQMQAVIAQQRISYATLHDGIRDDLLRRQVLVPVSASPRAPRGLIEPYATLLLDRRVGSIGLVPARADDLPKPNDADVAAWYKAHLGRYSLPERRVVRYALVGPEQVHPAAPTDAEIAAAYHADAKTYAASETRALSQVVLPDEAAARAFAARVAGGTPFAKAAADAGFAAADIALGSLPKEAFARTATPAIADAAFALKAGGTTLPARTALGWTIVHVDAVKATAARTLEQARGDIAAGLARKKASDAIATLVQALQDATSNGTSFVDAAARHGLAVVTTPPLLPDGSAPTVPGFKPDPTLTLLMRAATQATPDDEPSVETIGPDRYALLGVANVLPAAPVPLAEIRERVLRELTAQRAGDRARATAAAILAKVAAGQPMAAAFAAAHLPPPQAVNATQVDVAQQGDKVPPAIRTMFRLAPGKGDLAPAPGGGGWFVVRLDRIDPGSRDALPAIVAATQGELTRSLGEEYAEQFAAAARRQVKVTRNAAGLARLEQQLRGTAPVGQ